LIKIAAIVFGHFLGILLLTTISRFLDLLFIFGVPILIGLSGVKLVSEITPIMFPMISVYPMVFIAGTAAGLIITFRIATAID